MGSCWRTKRDSTKSVLDFFVDIKERGTKNCLETASKSERWCSVGRCFNK